LNLIWKYEISCLFLLIFIFVRFINNCIRLLNFIIFLEIFIIFQIYFLKVFLGVYDYTIILKLLIIIRCERAISLSLLVVCVRTFSVDKLGVSAYIKCEGF
jgi:hypothetical protein